MRESLDDLYWLRSPDDDTDLVGAAAFPILRPVCQVGQLSDEGEGWRHRDISDRNLRKFLLHLMKRRK